MAVFVGRDKMKTFKVLIFLVVYLFVHSNAIANNHVADMKCHVELLGGKQTVLFSKTSKSKVKSMTEKRKNVYKVIECVPLAQAFSTSASKNIDKQTVR